MIFKPEKAGNGRRVIIGLFLATVLISLGFYLKTEIPIFWGKITTPLVITNIPPQKKFDPTPVLNEVKNLTKDLRGTYGIFVYRFGDKNEYGLHQSEIFPAASLMKLPVMLTLYQEVEAGRINLETKYKLIEKDKIGGAGVLLGKPTGSVYTYRQLAEFMGQYSDNTAFGILRKILGEKKIEQIIKDLGMSKTSLAKNETTPEDIGIFFRQLYQGGVVNREHREEILKFLTKTGFEDRIPAGVPKGVRVAHKIGTEIGVFSDAGIVFTEKPFVLVIMSKNARESEAKETLPKITKAAWGLETSP